MKVRVIALLIGLAVNAFGNGLTVSSNTGSAIYTAASVDLFKLTNFMNVSVFVFAWGLVNAIAIQFLIKRFEAWRFTKEIIYTLFFSYFIDVFVKFDNMMGLPKQSWLIRTIFSLVGTLIIGISISIYQRANLVMHPNDDLTNVLRFDYLHGNVVWAQVIDLLFPVLVIIICSLLMWHVYAVSIATICYFFCTGTVIKYTDRWLWPSLVHNF